MKKILICPDSSPAVGVGHVKRSKALYDYIKKYENIDFLPLDFSSKKNIESFHDVDLILFDTHKNISHLVSDCHKRSIKTVLMDNFHEDARTLGINIFDHQEVKKTKTVTSFNHIILRDEVLAIKNKSTKSSDYLLISLGGGDVLSQSEFVLGEVRKVYKKKIVLVTGEKAKFSAQNINHDLIEILHHPANFLNIMHSAEFVICNGGSTLFEAVFLNKKCVVFPQSEYELNIAMYFYNNKYILGHGLDGLRYLNHSAQLNFANVPYDGHGVQTIFNILKGLL